MKAQQKSTMLNVHHTYTATLDTDKGTRSTNSTITYVIFEKHAISMNYEEVNRIFGVSSIM